MGDSGGDIIIKGGSCDLIFRDDMYPPDPDDPSKRKNKKNQKVVQVVITGDIKLDTGVHNEGLKFDLKVICKD